MDVHGVYPLFGSRHSLKYIILCSAEESNSYRFETTWKSKFKRDFGSL